MSRWEYDSVFYRVFCITLLGVGFAFTVILTNVFLDIDGLLSKKDKVKTPKPSEPLVQDLPSLSRVIAVNMLPEDKSEETYDEKDYPDSDDLYRSKRSLEATDKILHIKDPKVKKLLTNHLAELLDELDKESNTQNIDQKTSDKTTQEHNKNNYKEIIAKPQSVKKSNEFSLLNSDTKLKSDAMDNIGEYLNENKKDAKELLTGEKKPKKNYKAELLHLAMHNIILQGIVENTDLDEVYNKVVNKVKEFEEDHYNINKDDIKNLVKTLQSSNHHLRLPIIEDSNEAKNDGIIPDFGQLKRDMNPISTEMPENKVFQKLPGNKNKDRNVIIKTIIDITALTNDKSNKENNWNAKDKINGIIKVIYNGHTLKFQKIDDKNSTTNKNSSSNSFQTTKISNMDNTIKYNIFKNIELDSSTSKTSYFQKAFYDYLKGFKTETENTEQQKIISKKRLKRHVKIRFDSDRNTTTHTKKKDDDELFVEIETHFDSKGTKGEKKKKLIRDLIEKIQSAIHSDKTSPNKKKPKHWHVKKRLQNPLSSKSAAVLLNKLILPFETLAHRHLDPISKAVPLHEDMPMVANVYDRNHWQRPFYGPPRFFSKFINSAEMNTFESDYNKVMRHNGIPQRLQKPLNTDMSDEIFADSKVYDLGNVKFLMKDIDGSGFSIGFNQYTDQAPDSETMKLFSGLENIIQTYHQQYDQENPAQLQPNGQEQVLYDNNNNAPNVIDENEDYIDNHDQHILRRRSIQSSDETEHIAKNYRVVSGQYILPYKTYDDIFNSEKGHLSHVKNMNYYRTKKSKKSSFLLDENVFEKKLKPAEILSIADFFQRKKRSLKVKKISNVKIKTKINRYLNTKKMASKSVFKNNKKRTKRQIDKIRIIARDLPQPRGSEEEMFVESDEKIFADRALIREIDMPELDPNDKPRSIEHYDIISPQKDDEPYDLEPQVQKTSEDHYDIITPYVYEPSPFESPGIFSRRARHNSLMSKYPHIIMEEPPTYLAPTYAENREEYVVDDAQQVQYEIETTSINPVVSTLIDIPTPNEDQDFTDLLYAPPKDNTNYRVSVKIRPKNTTGMSGYKEVHTSINKSYNKNGVMYTSLVNVSQLSKVEKVNKTMTRKSIEDIIPVQDDALKQQQEIIKAMIQQHKLRLDQQLKHLQMERMKLETIDSDNFENITETLQATEATVKPKKNRKANQGGGKKKVKPESTTAKKPITTQAVTTQPTTKAMTTTEYVKLRADDHFIRTKMIETIERNENITNELLKKIDQNTGVLEAFLGKLIQTMEIPTKKLLEEATTKKYTVPTTTDKAIERSPDNTVGFSPQIDRNIAADSHLPFNFEDYHYMPSMLFRNMPKQGNNSMGIPFVYAVQHPYGAVQNKDMASVVYHGHIHTNSLNENNIIKRDSNSVVQKRPEVKGVIKEKSKVEKKDLDSEFWKPKPGEKVIHDFVVNKNTSKFFLDENHNDFKIPLLVNDNSTKVS